MLTKFETLTPSQREALETAARPLWDALGELGWVDGHGGAEFSRVFPDACNFIHAEANPSLEEVLNGTAR